MGFAAAALSDSEFRKLHVSGNHAWLQRIMRRLTDYIPTDSPPDIRSLAIRLVALTEGLATLSSLDPDTYNADIQRSILTAEIDALLGAPKLKEHFMTHHFSHSNISEMDPIVLYKILQLRTDVFVVEQNCAYPELDGRDLESDCELIWATIDNEITGTTRILKDPDALRIGRVVVAPNHRGTGIARELFAATLERCKQIDSDFKIVLDAQAPLQRWYGSFGFTPVSDVFMEDGVPHITMEKLWYLA